MSARNALATGGYEFRVVKNGNVFMPTALLEYDFTYDKAGNLLSATEDQAAVADMDGLGKAAGGLGVRTSYTLDALNRVTRTEQAVAATGQVTKRADYAYRGDGLVSSVNRFAGAGTSAIGTSTAVYDGLSRLMGITHAPTASASIAYGYTYDTASRIQTMTTPEGTSSFTLDGADQLLSASLTGEAYAYDNTGNRTSGGTQTGSGNRLLSDGTYRYAYDAEGNRTAKFLDTNTGGTLSLGDTDVTLYGYDQRNRLVAVSHTATWTSTQAAAMGAFGASGAAIPGSDLELRYTYDYADRRIRRMIDADGQAGSGQESVSFAGYAGDVRTLEIARPNDKLVIDSVRGPIGFLGQVVQRNFYGNGVDEILAVDQVSWNGTTPTTSTFWTFTDHQDSVRDIVSGNAADRGAVVEHRQYDSFGRIVRRTTGPQATAPATAGVGIDFGYAGRPLEARTGLSDNRARWYEPGTGRFINEDPSGFRGGDANLFRYVGNDPVNKVDPSGLAAKWASYAGASAVPAAAFAGLGQQGSTTLSGATGSQVKASTATPTISLAASNTASANPSKPLAFASLVTTGRAASYAASQWKPQWTTTDREAALRADMAYFFNHGGLLKDLKVGYNAQFTDSGLSAMLTRSPTTDKYYLAFRGTESLLNGPDMHADFVQGVGLRATQYDLAIRLTQMVKDKLGKDAEIVLTGHSLGGGLAAAASYATGIEAVLFNPPSVNRIYSQGESGRIRSHVIAGDILSVGRTVIGRTAPGEIIVHPPRSAMPLTQHSMNNFPDY